MDYELLFRVIASSAAVFVLGLIAWQRVISSEVAVLKEKTKSIKENDDQAQENLKSIHEIRYEMMRDFVRREDYISQISLFDHKMDATAGMVARLDERVRGFIGEK